MMLKCLASLVKLNEPSLILVLTVFCNHFPVVYVSISLWFRKYLYMVISVKSLTFVFNIKRSNSMYCQSNCSPTRQKKT